MATVRIPTFDISTPDKMAKFLHDNICAYPNGKKSVNAIQADDFILLDDHPCRMSNPPKISHLQSLSGEGYEEEKDEKLIIVHGVSCIDGVEYIEMFATDAVVRIFLDDHVEREWLVTGREGMRVFLQMPGDPSADKWILWMQEEKKIPCIWHLARYFPGKISQFTMRWESFWSRAQETPPDLLLGEMG